jgi:hypothetical protein
MCPESEQVTDELEYKKALYYGYKGTDVNRKESDQVVGDLGCFCQYLHDKGQDVDDITFTDVNPNDDKQYCKLWK